MLKNEIPQSLVVLDEETGEFVVVATGEKFSDFFEAVEKAKAVEAEDFSLKV